MNGWRRFLSTVGEVLVFSGLALMLSIMFVSTGFLVLIAGLVFLALDGILAVIATETPAHAAVGYKRYHLAPGGHGHTHP